MTTSPLRIAILGAGGRGYGFAQHIRQNAHLAQVEAVAEPRDSRREGLAREYGLPPERCFRTWQDFVAAPKLCDAVVISTLDRDHVGPAVACLDQGYHLLLEKPMATTLEDCRAIEAAQRRAGTVAAVCHSLRYHKGFGALRETVASGRIGRLVTLDQIEQVAFWHQAHSYVRGNWGNEGRSTFMLMAKSCHDLDYIAHLVDAPCRRVSSHGALTYFREANAPAGSTARCTDGCAVEATCPYSAIRRYVLTNREAWPANVASHDHAEAAHWQAIRSGPYGRCVYRCDNDVVDHQTASMEFDGDITATFTMTAFTQNGGRRIRVHGTEGEAFFDEESLVIKTFADNNTTTILFGAESGGHGGGDARVVRNWLDAIGRNDPGLVCATIQESLRTHTLVFAAEQSRREKRMIAL